MPDLIIDLRSDTLTQPTPEMLQASLSAPLGDDSRDGDPTVLELEALAAEMLGKEAAMLTASGTMSNLIALRTLADAGALDLDPLKLAVRKAAVGFPARGLVALENTHNHAGGSTVPPAYIAAACEIAHAAGLPVHMDGARLFNAAVALGAEARQLVEEVGSVSFCLSKGLSAPVGSLLLGRREFIARAQRVRRALGGAMRQAGIIAAPDLVALRTMIPRLAEEHANARRLAQELAPITSLGLDLATVQTNIVNVDVAELGIDSTTFDRYLSRRGVRGLTSLTSKIRFVTYRGITEEDVDEAARIIRQVVEERPWRV